QESADAVTLASTSAHPLHSLRYKLRDIVQAAQFDGQRRVHKQADAFYVVVELASRERLHNRRDFRQRAVPVLLGEVDLDVELCFALHRWRVEEDLVGGDAAAELRAGQGGELLGTCSEPRIRAAGK